MYKGGNRLERNNRLSDNLKAYQTTKKKTLAEFSEELGIARSTVQSIMADGNTTVDTLIRLADALHTSLDDLVFGELPIKRLDDIQHFLKNIGWFTKLSPQQQRKFRYHLCELLKLLEYGDENN